MLYLIVVCAILFITNIISLYFVFRFKKTKNRQLTTDANQLLSNLLNRGSVVITQIADPTEMFLYSPKDINQ